MKFLRGHAEGYRSPMADSCGPALAFQFDKKAFAIERGDHIEAGFHLTAVPPKETT